MKKYLLFVLISFVLASCSKKDEGNPTEETSELPLLFIDPIMNIKGDKADSGGDVLVDGGSTVINRGMCWSTNPNPTVDDFKKGSGAGVSHFDVLLSPLEFNTTYYVRAYATNDAGTAYSDELSFTTTNECTLNIFSGDIVLSSQSEVDAFGADDYCQITGDLFIEQSENATSDFIVDLTPLRNLRRVNRLRVTDNTQLESLEGLNNIDFIFDSVTIERNLALENVDGLGSVNSALTSISVRENQRLLNIDGLSGISALIRPTGYNNPPFIFIQQNDLLENIDGLSGITAVTNDTNIGLFDNSFVTNLNGLENISGTVDLIQLSLMRRLDNIEGLSGINRVEGEISIFNCDAIGSLVGLHNIDYVGSSFQILFNDNLDNLDPLANLDEVDGNFTIRNNSLTDFCGLQNLFGSGGVGGQFLVEDNAYNPTEQDIIDGNCAL